MDFFDAQDRSRRNTRYLIFLYALATLAVAAGVTLIIGVVWFSSTLSTEVGEFGWLETRRTDLAWIALATLAFIGIASLYRTASLREGGARVAREMGGSPVPADTNDPLRRRLRNVVEEMAIAAGVPVPDIFVMEHEGGINAFAAGYRPEDAAVAVTRGTLTHLDRNELQGVIAHEFSHILHGDMRLNIRLMGPLFGILALGLLGRMVLRNARFTRSSRSSGRSAGGLVVVGIGLAVIGYIGVLFARMIKAGVSRQREYLADASAVQFTRQTNGIAGALKKIGGLSEHSYIRRVDSEEVSHMLFGPGAIAFAQLLATHPPLLKRIRKLEPMFSDDDLERIRAEPIATPQETGVAGFAGEAPSVSSSADATFELASETIANRIGNPIENHVRAAQALRVSIPERLYRAIHSVSESLLLALALVLHPDGSWRETQLGYLAQQLGKQRTEIIEELFYAVQRLGPQYRLPILELAFPAIKNRPDDELNFLQKIIDRLIHADQRVELFEYVLARSLQVAMTRARHPSLPVRASKPNYRRDTVRRAIFTVFGALAVNGHAEKAAAFSAFRNGLVTVDPALSPQAGETIEFDTESATWPTELDEALETLQRFAPRYKRSLVQGLVATASHDGRITLAESELLRMLCAVLECPVPPLYVSS